MMALRKCHLLVTFVFFQICLCNVVKAQDDDEAITKYGLKFQDTENPAFLDGATWCAEQQMKLVSIKSKEKNDAIFKHVAKIDNSSCYYTSAIRTWINGGFYWYDQTRLSFRNFAENLPNNAIDPKTRLGFIVAVRSNGTDLFWEDIDSSTKCKAICEKESQREMDPGPPEPPFPDRLKFQPYLITGKNLTHLICQYNADNRTPVYIRGQKQMDDIKTICKANDDRYPYYLPMERKDINSPFMWDDGTPVTWFPNSIGNSSEKNLCIQIVYKPELDAMVWEDVPCDEDKPVMCGDKPIDTPSTPIDETTIEKVASTTPLTILSTTIETPDTSNTEVDEDATISGNEASSGSASINSNVEETSVSEETQSPNMPLVTPEPTTVSKPETSESISTETKKDNSIPESVTSGGFASSEGAIAPNMPPETPPSGDGSISGSLPASGSGSTGKPIDVSGGSTAGAKQKGKSKRCKCRNRKNKKTHIDTEF
uniref:Uncharacterized protein LOC114330110 n=1 Tax=Diabrotica virgifera virgifera TaxID=50390 RepID=A0A6P7FJN8_DIAVI